MFDEDKVKQEWFASKNSYKAAIWAGLLCNNILEMKEQGFTFFLEGSHWVPEFKFHYNESFEIFIKDSEHCSTWIVGDVHSDVNGEWKVYCTKKELTEFFKRIKFVNPKEFKRFM